MSTVADTRTSEPIASLLAVGDATDGEVRTSENPARPEEPVGRYTVIGPDAVAGAVGAAVEAAAAWRRRSALERGSILRDAAALLAKRRDEIAGLLTAEEGKTLDDSRKEVAGAIDTIHYHASSAWWPNGSTFHSVTAGDLVRTIRVPVGVVGLITPWNFPVSIPVWKMAPALVHGNAVLWKPATPTPIVSVRLAEVFLDAGVPRGVLQVLLGDGAVGGAIVDDERVDAISFTGSEAVGRRVAAAAAARNAKCQLELGGHNPAIVLADADLDVVVPSLVRAIANGTGQKCTASRRIIVEAPIRDALVDALRDRFGRLRVGDGTEPGVEVGPLVNAGARVEVAAALDAALADGCEVLVRTDGAADDGAFFAPTLLGSADQSPAICREEVFGPISVLVPAADADEALRLTADTRFGLSAALFTRSERIARRAAEELPVGVLNINRASTATELHLPFGGAKASSAPGPPEQGMSARDFYTETRTVFSTAIS
jgi:aldehyde dehydrogenase (NAD+)